MPFKPLFRARSRSIPLLAPSLLSAISLIYWFGNQGVAEEPGSRRLGIDQIYGAPGIVLAEVFSDLSARVDDRHHRPRRWPMLRLYEAADALGTTASRANSSPSPCRAPNTGSSRRALVTFTLVITDFGIPKVIGGSFNVLATDVFKLVIGQQDFQKRRRGGAAAAGTRLPDLRRWTTSCSRKQTAMLTARAVPYRPKTRPRL